MTAPQTPPPADTAAGITAEMLGAARRGLEAIRTAALRYTLRDEVDEPTAVAATPDGARVVVLLRAAGRRTALVSLDTATGAASRAVSLPGEALGGLVVSAERVYVPDALGHGVWVVDHRQGRLLDKVPAGRGPLAITLSPPS